MPARPLSALALTVALGLPAAAADWIELLKAGPDSPWKAVDKGWITAADVALDPDAKDGKGNPAPGRKLKATAADNGTIWVNGTTGRLKDLVTKEKYGDLEMHVEFLIAKGSNSGVKFHEVYEIQILDSAGKPSDKLSGDDCGGVYPRAELTPKYHHIDRGIAPKANAAKPAGEWQSLDITFRAPRFDADGKKTENARIVKATLNGTVIHENQELLTPTGHNYVRKETPTGPFMLQADHGPVAFRNVKIRAVEVK